MTPIQTLVLNQFVNAIKKNDYKQNLESRWQNILGRLYESQISTELITNPTKAMISATAKISKKILEIISKQGELKLDFPKTLTQEHHWIALGSFVEEPTYPTIKKY